MSNLPRRHEELPVVISGVIGADSIIIPVATDIRAVYSSVAVLLAGATLTGTAASVRNYKYLCGTVYADQPGTLFVEFSSNGGTDWDGQEEIAYPSGQRRSFHLLTAAPHARVRFTNTGLLAQTAFRLYVWGKLN